MNDSSLIISGDLSDPESDEGTDLASHSETRALFFTAELHGLRLDLALVELVPEFSRNYLRQLIESGAVALNGVVVCKPSAKVKAGARGSIELRPTPQSQSFTAEHMAMDLVFIDEHLLILNKPVGLVVHPAPGNWSGTLLNGLLAFDSQAATLPRAGIVHRLDKNTSGLMMIARTRKTMDALVEMIAERSVNRQYLALVPKAWSGPSNRHIDRAIGRDSRNRLRMAVVDLDSGVGKVAQTTIDVVEGNSTGTLVRCTLHTGRTHQIRVHLASIGYPLLGDTLYGGTTALGMECQALHAYCLAFTHPVTKVEMEFFAPLTSMFESAMAQLGLRYNKKSASAP